MITQTRYGQASAGSAPGEPEAHRAPDRGARRGANTYLTVSTCRALGDAAVARAEADGVSVSTLVRRALAEWARRARVHLTPCGWTSPSRGARCRSRCGSYVAAVLPPQWARVLYGTARLRQTTVPALVRRAVAEYLGRPELGWGRRR